MDERNEANAMLYMLAGVGLGAIIGAAAGILLAPKSGQETREELSDKLKELKGKTEEWINEQKAKKGSAVDKVLEEVGA